VHQVEFLTDPFSVTFVGRAAIAGLLVAVSCACAGTWVILRGMAFLGDAMSHGMLPGVALASLTGVSLSLGAGIAAALMAVGVTALQRNRRLGTDTTIGLLFVGMLAVGVIIVSASGSFAVDVTAFLFGEVLAVQRGDLVILAVTTVVIVAMTILGHRAFLVTALDRRIAQTSGFHPSAAHIALLAMLTLAIVATFSVVGTLLVFGMLIAPPAAAALWTSRVSTAIPLAAALGGVAVLVGLLTSWHASTAAGATITACAVLIFALALGLRSVVPAASRPLERTI